jgi:glycerophosphoryl diester phosphodiesterase
MEQAHKHGYRIHVYTVNQVDVLHRLKEMQVDGIFTDDPLLARQVLSPVSI